MAKNNGRTGKDFGTSLPANEGSGYKKLYHWSVISSIMT